MNNQTLQQIVKELDKRVEELQREKDEAFLQRNAAREKARQLEYDAKHQAIELRERSGNAASAAERKLDKMRLARDTLIALMCEQEDQS